jgi:hypothetical protein
MWLDKLEIALLIFITSLTLFPLHAEFAGGTGTADDPWQIDTHEHLNNVRNYLGEEHSNKHFILINDIDLSDEFEPGGAYYPDGWIPIGHDDNNNFRSNFDGDGHLITGLKVDAIDGINSGLFGFIQRATIKNLGLEDVWVFGINYIGSLAGKAYYSTITNSYSTGYISGYFFPGNMGGLIGYAYLSDITDCYSINTVNGFVPVGGLVGKADSSSITNCHSESITTGEHSIGNLIGEANSSIIKDSHSSGSVEGRNGGGLIGKADYSTIIACSSESELILINHGGGLVGKLSESSLSDSYYTGNINGFHTLGGLVGLLEESSITSSYSIGDIIGNYKVGGLVGHIRSSSQITDCYSRVNIIRLDGTETSLGGFCGLNAQSEITNSFSTGYVKTSEGENIEGRGFVGAIISGASFFMDNNYFDMESSEQTSSVGAEGRTTEEMTYPYAANTYVYWDFEETWGEDIDFQMNNGYPFLLDVTVPTSTDDIALPGNILSSMNYPNPFNPETTIAFDLPESGNVRLDIYNIRGQKVTTLINKELNAGNHQFIWNGKNQQGNTMPSGVYLYRVDADGGRYTSTRKMLLLK